MVKQVLLWDPRFPASAPVRAVVSDTIAVAVAADPYGVTIGSVGITLPPLPLPSITFSSVAQTVSEAAGSFSNTINVARNGVTGPLLILLAYTGTAIAGLDYDPGPASVTVPAGQNNASFNLTLIDDTAVEANETIVITAVLGASITSRTITVTSDDVANPPATMPTFSQFASNYAFGVNMSGYQYEFADPSTAKLDGAPMRQMRWKWDYMQLKGVQVVRIPFLWEHVQPALFGPLGMTMGGYSSNVGDPDRNSLQHIKSAIAMAASRGMKVVLECKNYGSRAIFDANGTTMTARTGYGYDPKASNKKGKYALGSAEVPHEAFADLWRRLAAEFRTDATVIGFDIMNEPRQLTASYTWEDIPLGGPIWTESARQAILAIRAADAPQWIIVEGYANASTGFWVRSNPDLHTIAGIDPLNRLMFSPHLYFDLNHSGTYTVAANEATAPVDYNADLARMLDNTAKYKAWADQYGVKTFVGETGAPNTPSWQEIQRRFLQLCRDYQWPVTTWGTWPSGAGGTDVNDLTPTGGIMPGANTNAANLAATASSPADYGTDTLSMKVLAAFINPSDGSENTPLFTIPVNTVAPAITGTAQEGASMTVSNGTWTGGQIAYAFQWKRDGVAISGAINASRTVLAADVGSKLTCTVTATNGAGATPATSAATATVVAAATALPSNTTAPAVSGTAAVGQGLSTTNGDWSNAPTSYAYQWQRDGVDISGATSNTYTVVPADAGKTISCRVSATNAGGTSAVTSNGLAIPAAATGMAAILSNPIFEIYPTNSQTLANMIAAPADASASTAYDWVRGQSTAVETADPSYVAAGNGMPDHLEWVDASDSLQLPASTAFLRNIGNDRDWTLILAMRTPANWSGSPVLFACSGNASANPGFRVRYNVSTGLLQLHTPNGSTTPFVALADSTLPTSTDILLVLECLNGAETARLFVNSATPRNSGTSSGVQSIAPLDHVVDAAATARPVLLTTHPAGTVLYGAAFKQGGITATEINGARDYLEAKLSLEFFN